MRDLRVPRCAARILQFCTILALLALSWNRASAAQSVTCIIEGACPYETSEGGSVAIHVRCSVGTGTFGSLDLLSLKKDSVAAAPVLSPELIGLEAIAVPDADEIIFYWETAPGDAGSWEICFEGTNDLGDADTCCYTLSVGVPDGNHVAWRSRHLTFEVGEGPIEVDMVMSTKNSVNLGGVVWPILLASRSGGAFFSQPILDTTDGSGSRGVAKGCLRFSDAFVPVFASRSTNTFSNNAVSLDSVGIGLISFSGPLAPGTYEDALTMFAEIADREGVIAVDTVTTPGFWPTFNDVTGATFYPTYSPGCFAVTIGEPCPVEITGDINVNGAVTSADIIAMVHVVFYNHIHRSEPCLAASDVNGSGRGTSADIIYLVNTVFKGGPEPCDVCPLIRGGAWECEP